MAKPTSIPEWARIPQNDPISGEPNILEPEETAKDSGWLYKQKPPQNWFNWLLNLTGKWIKYLNDEYIPDIESRVSALEGLETGITDTIIVKTASGNEIVIFCNIEIIEKPRYLIFNLTYQNQQSPVTPESKAYFEFSSTVPSVMSSIADITTAYIPVGSGSAELKIAHVVWEEASGRFAVQAQDAVFRGSQTLFPATFIMPKVGP